MFHRFDELGPEHVVVRATRFAYDQTPALTYLIGVTHEGWKRKDDLSYEVVPMPTVELGYGRATIRNQARVLEPESSEHLPAGIDSRSYQLLDYNGEGLPGVLTEISGSGW